jgi:predicted signal transduction protein with EAL and GGDEF domain
LLQQPFTVGAVELTIDATVGHRDGPRDSAAAEELLQLADLAMYSAKARRTGVAVYDDARDGRGGTAWRRWSSSGRAWTAASWCCTTSRSWTSPWTGDGGSRPWSAGSTPSAGCCRPADFVDLAEGFGLMSELTRRVLDAALLQCRPGRTRACT